MGNYIKMKVRFFKFQQTKMRIDQDCMNKVTNLNIFLLKKRKKNKQTVGLVSAKNATLLHNTLHVLSQCFI